MIMIFYILHVHLHLHIAVHNSNQRHQNPMPAQTVEERSGETPHASAVSLQVHARITARASIAVLGLALDAFEMAGELCRELVTKTETAINDLSK